MFFVEDFVCVMLVGGVYMIDEVMMFEVIVLSMIGVKFVMEYI